MLVVPGAPWRGRAGTGPTPRCTCAGTAAPASPEPTAARPLRCGRHECPVGGLLGRGLGPAGRTRGPSKPRHGPGGTSPWAGCFPRLRDRKGHLHERVSPRATSCLVWFKLLCSLWRDP